MGQLIRVEEGHPAYDTVKQFVNNRVDFAKRRLDGRRDKWREAEKQYRAYLDLEAIDRQRKKKDGEGTYPGFAPLIIPIPYAIVNTILTYLVTVFGARRPIIQIDGIGPEDIRPAEALETVMAYQMDNTRLLLRLYQWFHDILVYGVGYVKNTWQTHYSYQTVLETPPAMSMLAQVFGFDPPKRRTTRYVKGYEGNWPEVMDPFRIWHDPRVPISRLQDGEFVAFAFRKSYNLLLQDENNGIYYNIEKIKNTKGIAGGHEESTDSDIPRQMRIDLDDDEFVNKDDAGYPLLREVWARTTGRELKINSETQPRIWVITLANKEVPIRVEASDYNHGQYIIDAAEYLPDVHVPLNPGIVELITPLTEHMTWLFNSHMENVRKSINDMFVWDPSRVRQEDIEARGPGKSIRLKTTAYGTDVRSAVTQLAVADVTRAHLQDADVVWQLIQRITGATDNFMGLPHVGGAKTATEIRGTQQLASGRLKSLAEMIGLMGFQPFARKCVQNTQQYLEDERFYRIVGRSVKSANVVQHIKVAPEEIMGNFDFPVIDGTFPLDRFAIAEAWKEIFTAVVQVEPLLQIFDVVEIFKQEVMSLGVKNIDDFILQPGSRQAMVMRQEDAEKKAQEGNAVPTSGPGAPPGAIALGDLLGANMGQRNGR